MRILAQHTPRWTARPWLFISFGRTSRRKFTPSPRSARDAHVSSATDRRLSRPATTTTMRSRSQAPLPVASSASSAARQRRTFSFCPPDAVFGVRRWLLGNLRSASAVAHALATNAGSVAHWLPRKHPHTTCAEPDPLSAQGGGDGVGGEKRHPPPCVEFCGNMAEIKSRTLAEVVVEWWADTWRLVSFFTCFHDLYAWHSRLDRQWLNSFSGSRILFFTAL